MPQVLLLPGLAASEQLPSHLRPFPISLLPARARILWAQFPRHTLPPAARTPTGPAGWHARRPHPPPQAPHRAASAAFPTGHHLPGCGHNLLAGHSAHWDNSPCIPGLGHLTRHFFVTHTPLCCARPTQAHTCHTYTPFHKHPLATQLPTTHRASALISPLGPLPSFGTAFQEHIHSLVGLLVSRQTGQTCKPHAFPSLYQMLTSGRRARSPAPSHAHRTAAAGAQAGRCQTPPHIAAQRFRRAEERVYWRLRRLHVSLAYFKVQRCRTAFIYLPAWDGVTPAARRSTLSCATT